MKKCILWMQNYLLYASPLVLICIAWSTVWSGDVLVDASPLAKMAWEVLSWNLMLWFAVLILFLIFLVVVPDAREKTLARLANLKERDEREQFITGKAARTPYISTLSVMMLLLFISIFSLNIYRVSKQNTTDGKTGRVTIALSFALLDKPVIERDSGVAIFDVCPQDIKKSV